VGALRPSSRSRPPRRPFRHGFLALAVVVATLAPAVVSPLAGAGPAGAAPPISVSDLQLQIAANAKRIDVLIEESAEAERQYEAAVRAIADNQQLIAATKFQVAALTDQVRRRAAGLYVSASVPHDPLLELDLGHAADVAAAKHYGEQIARDDDITLQNLGDAQQQLEAREKALETARDQAETEKRRLDAERAALQDLLVRQRKLLAALDVIPILGQPQLTAAQIAGWFHSTGRGYRLAGGTTIDQLAQMYVQEGDDEYVKGDVAFAQAVLETGFFRSALDNNYSGIGACDSCSGEIAFPTPRDGVRAQIQHLRNYADPTSRASKLSHPPEAPLYGSDAARAASNFDTFFAKGSAQTWQVMGKGHWATDPFYATKVIGIYIQMVAYAAGYR
jgi:flagellum-specific peptidoglycan hydrolase FlgJ